MTFESLFWHAGTADGETLDPQRNYKFAGRFKLIRLLGKGGFGEVWEANDLLLDQVVALKLSATTLVDETLVLRRMPKDRYVSIFDYVHDSGMDASAYSMELLEEPWMTLTEYCDDYIDPLFKKPDNAIEAVRAISLIGIDILRSLNALHGKLRGRTDRWVHADIKPDNLYVNRNAAKVALTKESLVPFTKVGDLGLTCIAGAQANGGTPSYMAPEQVNDGKVSASTDIFAVGQTLAFMVLGEPLDESALTHISRIREKIAIRIPSAHLVERYCDIIRTSTLTTPALRQNADKMISRLSNLITSKEEWKVLSILARHRETGLNLKDTAGIIFEELKSDMKWRNVTKERLLRLENMVRSMYKRNIITKNGRKYFLR